MADGNKPLLITHLNMLSFLLLRRAALPFLSRVAIIEIFIRGGYDDACCSRQSGINTRHSSIILEKVEACPSRRLGLLILRAHPE
jgi:hypothetical protein